MHHHKLLLLEITEQPPGAAGGMGAIGAGNTGIRRARFLAKCSLDQKQENALQVIGNRHRQFQRLFPAFACRHRRIHA
ncbi:hypothetical protein D3C87_727290 [compost metagenome]